MTKKGISKSVPNWIVRVDRGLKLIRAARQTADTSPKVPNASAGIKQDQGNQPPTGGISWFMAGRPFGISSSLRKGIVWWRTNRVQFGSNPGSYQDTNLATREETVESRRF